VALNLDFSPRTEREQKLHSHLCELLEAHGDALFGAEIIGGWGHITANVEIFNLDSTQVLRVWGAKEARWKRPGAHIEISPFQTACAEAMRALGGASFEIDAAIWTLDEHIIEPYWNTPKHSHLELVFRAVAPENAELPTGARWFSSKETRIKDGGRLLQ